MPKVTVVAKLKAKKGLEEKVKQELLQMVAETRKENGCLNYDLHVDHEDDGTFLFYENWESQNALDSHFKTPHFVRLHGMSEELFASPAEIKIMKMVRERN